MNNSNDDSKTGTGIKTVGITEQCPQNGCAGILLDELRRMGCEVFVLPDHRIAIAKREPHPAYLRAVQAHADRLWLLLLAEQMWSLN